MYGGIYLSKLGINIIGGENEKELINIKIDGYANDETELIMSTINTLIHQLEVKDLSEKELERLEYEIKKLLLCIAEVYGLSGKNEALSDDEKVFNEIEEQFEASDKGKITILQQLLDSLKIKETVRLNS